MRSLYVNIYAINITLYHHINQSTLTNKVNIKSIYSVYIFSWEKKHTHILYRSLKKFPYTSPLFYHILSRRSPPSTSILPRSNQGATCSRMNCLCIKPLSGPTKVSRFLGGFPGVSRQPRPRFSRPGFGVLVFLVCDIYEWWLWEF